MKKQITKAVIPAAGFGTRMLPFTKAVPKELIPLVDKPVLQYVVEEAAESGITDILMIVSSGKEAIMRHFNPAAELETRLAETRKLDLLNGLRQISAGVNIHYIYQQQLNGLGDAVRLAASFAGEEPVAILLGDTVMDSWNGKPVTRQLCDVFTQYGGSVVALEQVPRERLSKYGVAGGVEVSPGVMAVEQLVEKPDPDHAPSDFAVAARYVFTPAIFNALKKTEPGLHGEIQLTDAMRLMMRTEPLFGCKISGHRYDLGSKAGFIAANVEFALRRSDLGGDLAKTLHNILKEKNL